jgi:hypothetical protein
MISTEEYNIAIMEVQKKWAGIRKAEQDKAEKEAEQARKERDAEIAQRRSDELKQFDDHINVNRLALLVQYQNGEIATREEYEQRVQELEVGGIT